MKWNNLSLHKIKWICSFIVVLLPFFCSISNIFQKYLAVTLWAIMMWMFARGNCCNNAPGPIYTV